MMISSPTSYVQRFLPLRLPKVCLAVTGSDPSELLEKAESLVRDNPFLELRLDYLSRPGMALPKIKSFFEIHPHAVVIATCRRASSGGKFRGSIPSQLDILGRAAAAGCQLVDVELQTAIKVKPEQLQKLRSRAALVLSLGNRGSSAGYSECGRAAHLRSRRSARANARHRDKSLRRI